MNCEYSADDQRFVEDFEACRVAAGEFTHLAHLRLAYVYLLRFDRDGAIDAIRRSLLRFLDHVGVERSKYHETMTAGWICLVAARMETGPGFDCFESFIAAHCDLQGVRLLSDFYSESLLFSDSARESFLPPDQKPLP